jgi:hypothetical protein
LQRKDERRRAQEEETSRDIETPAESEGKLEEQIAEKSLAKGPGI